MAVGSKCSCCCLTYMILLWGLVFSILTGGIILILTYKSLPNARAPYCEYLPNHPMIQFRCFNGTFGGIFNTTFVCTDHNLVGLNSYPRTDIHGKSCPPLIPACIQCISDYAKFQPSLECYVEDQENGCMPNNVVNFLKYDHHITKNAVCSITTDSCTNISYPDSRGVYFNGMIALMSILFIISGIWLIIHTCCCVDKKSCCLDAISNGGCECPIWCSPCNQESFEYWETKICPKCCLRVESCLNPLQNCIQSYFKMCQRHPKPPPFPVQEQIVLLHIEEGKK